MRTSEGEVLFPPPGKTARDDTAAVMKFFKLPHAFPKAVLAEAAQVAAEPLSLEGRLDLRKKFIFTCDPVTARDYDDALSLEIDRHGHRVLGVHIADVAHYVRAGSALDREAARRSTSVYFADRVVPMLPELLSAGVCSLMPQEDRLAFSVFMTFDEKGVMIARSFAKSVIRSQVRLTYEQVMAVLAGEGKGLVSGRIQKVIRAISALAQQLRALRFSAGALDLAMPEAELQLDALGEMTGLTMRAYDESHQMIEECMVAANEAVAKELWTKGVKILARLHEPPEAEKLELLRAEMRPLGVKVGDLSQPKVMAQFLQTIKHHPLYTTLSVMLLRSMKRAVYDATKIGHFGLAKRYYAHFTSPIRRYPDLTLHRQLAAYLSAKGASVQKAKVAPRMLATWAARASEREERAAEAERGLMEIKKFRFLEQQLKTGKVLTYTAVIVKCMPFGCFVEISEIAVSGLVHVSVLSHHFVRYSSKDGILRAPGGKTWKIGDSLRVSIAQVDFLQHRLDFIPQSENKQERIEFRRKRRNRH